MQGDTPKGGLYDYFLSDLDRMNSEDLETCKRENVVGMVAGDYLFLSR